MAWLDLYAGLFNSEQSTGRELDSLAQFASWVTRASAEEESNSSAITSKPQQPDHAPGLAKTDPQEKPWDMIIEAF